MKSTQFTGFNPLCPSEGVDSVLDDLLGYEQPTSPRSRNDVVTLKHNLRKAQNKGRGRPRAGVTKRILRQINVTHNVIYSQKLISISLCTGKTKREILEESFDFLAKKYKICASEDKWPQ